MLLAEAHACLLSVAKERAGAKYVAIDSLETLEIEHMDTDDNEVPLAEIAHEAKGLGYKAQLTAGSSSSRESPRAGWEDALAIYIRDVSGVVDSDQVLHY